MKSFRTRNQRADGVTRGPSIQIRDELGRLRAARDKGLLERPIGFDSHLEDAAEASVKYRWIQQCIWDERWEGQPSKNWTHEWQDPLSRMKPSDSMKGGGVTNKKTNHKRTNFELLKEIVKPYDKLLTIKTGNLLVHAISSFINFVRSRSGSKWAYATKATSKTSRPTLTRDSEITLDQRRYLGR